MRLKIVVHPTNEKCEVCDIDDEMLVSELKALIYCELDKYEPYMQQLIWNGQILNDDVTIGHYNISSDSKLILVAKKDNNNNSNNNNNNNNNYNRNSYSHTFEEKKESAQVNNVNTPDFMQQMLNMPMMQSIMNNPQLMRQMILSNPQMARLMNDNPELRRLVDDPNLMRQTMQYASDPALFQEMMRTNDRQISNIEMMPGGHNALRRLYQDVQEPIMNALQRNGNSNQSNKIEDANNSPNKPTTATPRDDAIPNPWKQNRSSNNSNNTNSYQNMFQQLSNNNMMGFMGNNSAFTRNNDHLHSQQNHLHNQQNTNTRELYAPQLAMLQRMGFTNESNNLEALLATGGNVEAAIEYLLTHQF